MAYDEQLAERVRDVLADRGGVGERRMFGGLAFMVDGHMACGIVGSELMLRLGEALADEALREPHVRPMDFTGRPMASMVYVAADGLEGDALAGWVSRAVAFVAILPPR
jgi:TfoX/Sxy family transcriptional regulator of competence genes